MRMMIDQVSNIGRREDNHGDARASSTNSNLATKHIDISSQASGSVGSRKNVVDKSKNNISRNRSKYNDDKKRHEIKLTETLDSLVNIIIPIIKYFLDCQMGRDTKESYNK